MSEKETITSGNFIVDGFKKGDVIHWPGGPGNPEPGYYTITQVESTEMTIKQLGWWSMIKYIVFIRWIKIRRSVIDFILQMR